MIEDMRPVIPTSASAIADTRPDAVVCNCVQCAVLVPCLNEAATIAAVVAAFRVALPTAAIYVYDNNSADATIASATTAGAIVGVEPRRGKGNVIRRMFADIEADVYVLVDGDATYDPNAAPSMVATLVAGNFDLINGMRVTETRDAYRPGHRLGNTALSLLVRSVFGAGLTDMLSGYKVLSRRFVKSMPVLSSGFEIETELAIHALSLRMPIDEMPTIYRERPSGSASKIKTYRDGIRILRTILLLIKEERPLFFFASFALAFAIAALTLAAPVLATFVETGLVPRLPTAVLAASIMVLAALSLACGLILDTVTRGRKEVRRIAYLAAGPGAGRIRTECNRRASTRRDT